MNEIKKSRSDVATSERAEEQRKPIRVFSAPKGDFITGSKEKQSFVDYIPHGHLNAITAAQLGAALSMSQRDVTLRIQAHRKYGAPICASCSEPYGYFLAEKPEELARYLKSLDGRLREVRNTRDAMADALCKMTGQTRMEGF